MKSTTNRILNQRYKLLERLRSHKDWERWLVKDLLANESRLLTLARSQAGNASLRKQFEAFAHIDCPYLAKVQDFGDVVEHGGGHRFVFLVTDYHRLQPLTNVLQDYGSEELIALVVHALQTLSLLHQNNILHRHISRDTIYLSETTGNLLIGSSYVDDESRSSAASETDDIRALGQAFISIIRTARCEGAVPTTLRRVLERMASIGPKSIYRSADDMLAALGRKQIAVLPKFLMRQSIIPLPSRSQLVRRIVDIVAGNKETGLLTVYLTGADGTGKSTLLTQVATRLRLEGVQIYSFRHGEVEMQLASMYRWLMQKSHKKNPPTEQRQQLFAKKLATKFVRQACNHSSVLICDDIDLWSDDERAQFSQFLRHLQEADLSIALPLLLTGAASRPVMLEDMEQQVVVQERFANKIVSLAMPLLTLEEGQLLLDFWMRASNTSKVDKWQLNCQAAGNPLQLKMLHELQQERSADAVKTMEGLADLIASRLSGLSEEEEHAAKILACIQGPIKMSHLVAKDVFSLGKQALPTLFSLANKGIIFIDNDLAKYPYALTKEMIVSLIEQHQQSRTLRLQIVDALDEKSPRQPLAVKEELLWQRFHLEDEKLCIEDFAKLIDALNKQSLFTRRNQMIELCFQYILNTDLELVGDEHLWSQLSSYAEILVLADRREVVRQLFDVAIPLWMGRFPRRSAAVDRGEVVSYLELLNQYIRLQRYSGDMATALAYTKQGQFLIEKYSIHQQQQKFASLRGTLELLLGKFDESLLAVNQGLTATKQLSPERVQLLLVKGHCYKAKAKYTEAQSEYRKALSEARRIEYLTGVGNAQQSLAIILEASDLKISRKLFEEAMHIFEKLGNVQAQMSCLYSLAKIYFDDGHIDEALTRIERCVAYYRRTKDKRQLGHALLRLGEYQLFIRKTHDGLANVRFSLWVGEEIELFHLIAEARWLLFKEELLAGNLKDARLHLDDMKQKLINQDTPSLIYKQMFAEELIHLFGSGSAAVAKRLVDLFQKLSNEISIDVILDAALMINANRALKPSEILDWVDRFASHRKMNFRQQLIVECLKAQLSDHQTSTELRDLSLQLATVAERLQPSQRRLFLEKWGYQELQDRLHVAQWPVDQVVSTHIASQAPSTKVGSLTHLLAMDLNKWIEAPTRKSLLARVLRSLCWCFDTDMSAVVLTRYADRSLRRIKGVSTEVVTKIPSSYTISSRTKQGKALNLDKDKLLTKVFSWVRQHEKEIFVENCSSHSLFSEFSALPRINSQIAAVPIFFDRGFAGMIFLEKQRGATFAPNVFQSLNYVATQVDLLVERIHYTNNSRAKSGQDKLLSAKLPSEDLSQQTLVAVSREMKKVMRSVARAENSDVAVIVQGESGSGKEMIAKKIHQGSDRRRRKMITVDCGAIGADLFDTQFFGYVRGAFTGAYTDHPGFFHAADGGTLVLDNVDELSLACQAKLLRVLQENEVRRVGGLQAEPIDVRIVVLSQNNLGELVEQGEFRTDLFYRLMVFLIEVPPLRQRVDDIQPLLEYFATLRSQKDFCSRLTSEALEVLRRYRWPGNIRELRNEVDRLVVARDQESIIACEHLSPRILRAVTTNAILAESSVLTEKTNDLTSVLEQVERQVIEASRTRHQGNISRMAEELGLPRSSLRHRMRRLGLTK